MSPLGWVIVGVLAIALGVLWHQSEQRHKRAKRRLARAENAIGELLRTRRRTYEHAADLRVRTGGATPRLPVEFLSQHGEDCFLWDLFEGSLSGRFIEVGAFDGRYISASYALESVGWQGVLIEPLPHLADKCRQARPGSTVVQAAASKRGSSGEATFTEIVGSLDAHSASFLESADARDDIPDLGGERRRVQVRLSFMDEILDEAGASSPIDVAIIDVEGAEADLIHGFDLDRWGVRVIVIEDFSEAAGRPLMKLLTGLGYEHVHRMGHNDVYVRTSDASLLARAKLITRRPLL